MLKKLFLLPLLALAACNSGNGNTTDVQAEDTSHVEIHSNSQMQPDSALQQNSPGQQEVPDDPESKEMNPDSAVKKNDGDAFLQFFNRLKQDLKSGNASALNQYVHPSHGLVLVYRPGAIDRIDVAASFSEAFTKLKDYNAQGQLAKLNCSPRYGKMPKNPCDGESAKGCIAVEQTSYNRLSEMAKAFEQYGFGENATPAARQKIPQVEKLIKMHLANLNDGMSMDFMQGNDGKWYLVVLDLARYSCSA